MIDPQKVAENWPKSLDANELSDPQKEGVEVIVSAWNTYGDWDKRKLAYILATAWHETAKTMQPIEEWGKGTKRPYGKPDQLTGQSYFGRGYAQLTWKENYERFGKLLEMDLVKHPEFVLNPVVSAKITVIGMLKGLFTGKRLSDYFTAGKEDWRNARRIINILDKAELIAVYAMEIHKTLV